MAEAYESARPGEWMTAPLPLSPRAGHQAQVDREAVPLTPVGGDRCQDLEHEGADQHDNGSSRKPISTSMSRALTNAAIVTVIWKFRASAAWCFTKGWSGPP